MKIVKHSDTCTVGSAADSVKLTVTFRGANTGVFEVNRSGIILKPKPDGSVPLGKAKTLPGTSILVKTLVNQVGPGTFFEVDYVLHGTTCGPFTVQDSFDAGDLNATVRETIKFS
jgi:hypothetical protein